MPLITTRPPRTLRPIAAPPEAVVTLPRRLDIHEVAQLRHQLLQLELGRGHRVTLDGSVVAHADRAGLELLVEARAQADEVGAVLTLTNTSLALRLAIELTGTIGVPAPRDDDFLVDWYTEAA